ncbi:glycine-rich RNA-binding protein 4, mitochondrial isoform X1 [Primulina tabacum]|uniref:glycine-rich RNA-binding protein 4, mitochondrial isoform X1 n=1 Tax=Primulina tabacum TaxID=48773 RepID=UPI003F591A0E
MHWLSRIHHHSFTSPLHGCLMWWRHSCTQLFVGGLSYDTNETILKDAFEKYGEVIEAVKVICDRVSGKSKGYGFVNYTAEQAAIKALNEMNGQLLDGRNIRLHQADGCRREQKSEKSLETKESEGKEKISSCDHD